MSANMSN